MKYTGDCLLLPVNQAITHKMKRIQFKSSPETVETKDVDARIEAKAENLPEGVLLHIKAYGLAFGNIDRVGDIIMPGACDKWLASEEAENMGFCWSHDRATVIGKITDKGVDDYGMWVEVDILPTTAGKDAAVLLKAGAVTQFSIGYRVNKCHFEHRDGYDYEIRILDEIEVYEVSPVLVPANPKAKIISAKAEGGEKQNNQPSNTTTKTMTPEEIKAMQESIEKAATEKASAALNAKIEEIKAKQEQIDAQKADIDKLDQTVKAQQETIKALQEKFQEKAKATLFGAIKAAVEERKDDIQALLKSNSGSLKVAIEFDETKTDYDVTVAGDITRIGWGAALDTNIAYAPAPVNAFLDSFVKETVNGIFFNWLEGTFTDQTGYVDELAEMADENAAVEEKTRQIAKAGSHLLISSEVTDFFTALYDWARNIGQRKLNEFADAEIFGGLGADTNSTTKKKIYGLKSQATAFSALGEYASPTIADVLLDATAQIKKEGYNANIAFVSFADEAAFRGVKDSQGHYLYNEATGMLRGLRIVPSAQVTADTCLVVDSSCVRLKQRPVFELEIVRNAKLDGWDVYLRKSIQTLVKTPDKKGLIWIASIASAITAITPSA